MEKKKNSNCLLNFDGFMLLAANNSPHKKTLWSAWSMFILAESEPIFNVILLMVFGDEGMSRNQG